MLRSGESFEAVAWWDRLKAMVVRGQVSLRRVQGLSSRRYILWTTVAVLVIQTCLAWRQQWKGPGVACRLVRGCCSVPAMVGSILLKSVFAETFESLLGVELCDEKDIFEEFVKGQMTQTTSIPGPLFDRSQLQRAVRHIVYSALYPTT